MTKRGAVHLHPQSALKRPPAIDAGWQAWASCGPADAEAFYPDSHKARIAAAKAVCAGCAVQPECLADALLTDDRWAVRGGYTPAERDRLRRQS